MPPRITVTTVEKRMKTTYLGVIAGVITCFAFPAQAGHGSKGMHRSGDQFHLRGQHHRERELTRFDGNITKREREREREKPNGAMEGQRQEQQTNGAGETQTRSQEGTTQPNP